MGLSFLSGCVRKVLGSCPRAACAILAVLAIAMPFQASAACAGSLSGSYGLLVTGSTTQGVSKFLTGVLNVSATCTVTGDIAIGENQVASSFVPLYAGSISTNSDGSLMLSLTLQQGNAPEVYAIGFSSAFNEAVGAEMDNSAVATIDLKPQAAFGNSAVASYSNVGIKGAFASSCSGITGTYTDLNNFTFDGTSSNGVGNIVAGVDYYNNYGQSGVEPYAGQYSVNADGTLTGYVIVANMQYGITGVVDNGGNEVQFVYSANGADITACTAKRVAAPQQLAPQSVYFACHVAYSVTAQSTGVFTAGVTLYNTGTAPLSSWTLNWSFANLQTVTSISNATFSQKAAVVTVAGASLPAGGAATPVTFKAKWNNKTNAVPAAFKVNGVACN